MLWKRKSSQISVIVIIVLCSFKVTSANSEIHKWDLAVAIDGQIELLSANGTLIGRAADVQFTQIKALTFDNRRHQFVMSEFEKQNDSIYAVQLTKEKLVTPIIEDLPDDIKGLAIDSSTDILYYTDTAQRTINYVSLNESFNQPEIFIQLKDGLPIDLTIDMCSRHIYWSNSDFDNPSIDRASLDNNINHQVLITSHLNKPAGITLDSDSQRIYWLDHGHGIYSRIESADFNGKNRRLIIEVTHQTLYGIALDSQYIYWTDTNNNRLWKLDKLIQDGVADTVKRFREMPRGLVARNDGKTCPQSQTRQSTVRKEIDESTEFFEVLTESSEIIYDCLNAGQLTSQNMCKCQPGFSGDRCQVAQCHNFCVNGDCQIVVTGEGQNGVLTSRARCNCPRGFVGLRCELYLCEGYCLNGGQCLESYNDSESKVASKSRGVERGVESEVSSSKKRFNKVDIKLESNLESRLESNLESRLESNLESRLESNLESQAKSNLESRVESNNKFPIKIVDIDNLLRCECREGFSGARCEHSNNERSLCDDSYSAMLSNSNSHRGSDLQAAILAHFEDPAFLLVLILLVTMLAVTVFLATRVCKLRRKPRVKKRFIVKKNVTPLTYRPHPVAGEQQQCEITIENCCNMNVCDTPCFEPPNLTFQTTKDEKKTLLTNMENGCEDLY